MANLTYIVYCILQKSFSFAKFKDSGSLEHLNIDCIISVSSDDWIFDNFKGGLDICESVKGTHVTRVRTDDGNVISEWFTFDSQGMKYYLWDWNNGFCENGKLEPTKVNVRGDLNMGLTESWFLNSTLAITFNCGRGAHKEASLLWRVHQLMADADISQGGLVVDDEFKRGLRLLSRSAKRMRERRGTPGLPSETNF